MLVLYAGTTDLLIPTYTDGATSHLLVWHNPRDWKNLTCYTDTEGFVPKVNFHVKMFNFTAEINTFRVWFPWLHLMFNVSWAERWTTSSGWYTVIQTPERYLQTIERTYKRTSQGFFSPVLLTQSVLTSKNKKLLTNGIKKDLRFKSHAKDFVCKHDLIPLWIKGQNTHHWLLTGITSLIDSFCEPVIKQLFIKHVWL